MKSYLRKPSAREAKFRYSKTQATHSTDETTFPLFIPLRRLVRLMRSARTAMRTGRTTAIATRRFSLFFTNNRAYDYRCHKGYRSDYDDDFNRRHNILPIRTESCAFIRAAKSPAASKQVCFSRNSPSSGIFRNFKQSELSNPRRLLMRPFYRIYF